MIAHQLEIAILKQASVATGVRRLCNAAKLDSAQYPASFGGERQSGLTYEDVPLSQNVRKLQGPYPLSVDAF